MRIRRKQSIMDRAHDYVESVADTVIPQLEAAIETARDKAAPALADARDRAVPLVTDARDRAVPLLQDARDRAVPVLQDARERAVPVLVEGRALAAEKAAAGAALAATKAAEGRDLAAAKVAELRQEPEPQRSKLKTTLLIGGLVALGGALAAYLRKSRATQDNWQSSYTPTPPTGGTTSATSPLPTSGVAGDPLTDPIKTPLDPSTPTATDAAQASDASAEDIGGGDPGEALSDSAEQPHEATTPDNPAEVIDVDRRTD